MHFIFFVSTPTANAVHVMTMKCCQSSKESRAADVEMVSSSLEDADLDTKLQFEQCAYDCLGKCWPSAAGTQRMIYLLVIYYIVNVVVSVCSQWHTEGERAGKGVMGNQTP